VTKTRFYQLTGVLKGLVSAFTSSKWKSANNSAAHFLKLRGIRLLISGGEYNMKRWISSSHLNI
jgi:hypothetical protein